MIRCPHCGGSVRVERSAFLRFRCGVCGGPMVPTEARRMRRGIELGNLVLAQRARAIAFGWTAAAVTFGAAGAMILVLALLLAWADATLAAAALGTISAIGFALSLSGWLKARARIRDALTGIDAAWEQVAEDVLESRGATLTADDLARALYTDTGHAESLLARLSAHGRTRVRVREDAELVYDNVTVINEDPDAASRRRLL